MKKKFKLFCFGFGQVAKFFVKKLLEKNYDFDLVTTNTSDTLNRKFSKINHKSYFFLNNQYDNELLKDLDSSNKILISIPPQEKKDIVLKNFIENFKKNKFDWVTYLSATNVYGDKRGQWVDEDSKTNPSSSRGIARLISEESWLKIYKYFNLPIQIFRLSGIYSAENNILNRIKLKKLKIVDKENHFFSRIHVEDIAEILTVSLNKFKPGQIFNISDDYPCSNQEIAKYAALLLKKEIPKKIKVDQINNESLKEFYNESKKVSNKKMKYIFDYQLKYPTFKEGLNAIINNTI